MTKRPGTPLPRLTTILAGMLMFIGLSVAAAAGKDLDPVKDFLISQGIHSDVIQQAFSPEPELMLQTVASAMRIREGELNYDQYLQPWALKRSRQFLRNNEELLQRMEKTFQVDRYTVTAILLVETRIGGYTGRTPILNILTTLALMDQPSFQDTIWAMLPEKDRSERDRSRFNARLEQRAKRGRKDLTALFKWYADKPSEISSLKGSIMGAVGWPQFLPDNVLHYGVDADQDGRIDLFDPADAAFSVAKYLRAAGWRADSDPTQKKAILRYNRSRPYMQTIQDLAQKLKKAEVE